MMGMRRSLGLLALTGCACHMQCGAGASAGIGFRAGLESPFIVRGGDGSAMLGLVIEPPSRAARAPVSMVLVVDTSFSMQGHSIEHARAAARAIVEALADGDEVGLVAFESKADTLMALTRVDAAARGKLLEAIDLLVPSGATALFDGVARGFELMDAARNPSRRLVLISDGNANVGPSKPDEIVAALRWPTRPTAVSSLGVGTDYDENVLLAVSGRGGGGFHHLTDPVQMRGILDEELQRARSVVAAGAEVELKTAAGVSVLEGSGLAVSQQAGGAFRIAIGDLHAGERRLIAVPLRVPAGEAGQDAVERLLGDVRLEYRSADGHSPPERTPSVPVRYRLTSSAEQAAGAAVPELMVAADRTRVGHALADAAAMIKDGDLLEAQAILRDERTRLTKRRERLAGAERNELDLLIALLRDPYVDVQLAPSTSPGTPRSAGRGPDLGSLIERVRQNQPLTGGELVLLEAGELRTLRNAAYARHGYPFKDPALQRSFAAQPWYHQDPSFDSGRLTTTDEANIALVRSYEGRATLASAVQPARAPRAARLDVTALMTRVLAGAGLASADLDGLDLAQLRLLRNASYARHGYAFRAADLQAYFGARSDYRPDPRYGDDALTAADRANIGLVKQRERDLVAMAGGEAVREFQLRSQAGAYRVLRQ